MKSVLLLSLYFHIKNAAYSRFYQVTQLMIEQKNFEKSKDNMEALDNYRTVPIPTRCKDVPTCSSVKLSKSNPAVERKGIEKYSTDLKEKTPGNEQTRMEGSNKDQKMRIETIKSEGVRPMIRFEKPSPENNEAASKEIISLPLLTEFESYITSANEEAGSSPFDYRSMINVQKWVDTQPFDQINLHNEYDMDSQDHLSYQKKYSYLVKKQSFSYILSESERISDIPSKNAIDDKFVPGSNGGQRTVYQTQFVRNRPPYFVPGNRRNILVSSLSSLRVCNSYNKFNSDVVIKRKSHLDILSRFNNNPPIELIRFFSSESPELSYSILLGAIVETGCKHLNPGGAWKDSEVITACYINFLQKIQVFSESVYCHSILQKMNTFAQLAEFFYTNLETKLDELVQCLERIIIFFFQIYVTKGSEKAKFLVLLNKNLVHLDVCKHSAQNHGMRYIKLNVLSDQFDA